MTPSEHVGARIRMYRLQKKLTLEAFSKMVNKSASTISKYESGSIVLDINSLFDISDALGVAVNQLTDYRRPQAKGSEKPVQGGFFQRADLFYSYIMFPNKKRPYTCVLEIIRDPEGDDRFIFYFDVADLQNYTNSNFLYSGTLSCFDYGTAFFLENPYNKSDVGMIYAKSPFSAKHTTTGVMTFLSQALRNPCSAKILFSLSPIPVDDELRRELSISDKETLSEIKKKNLLIVY